jgi:hypothetical protein
VPWVRIASCNPAELRDPDVPPVFSGYPAADRPAGTPTGTSSRARTRRCTPIRRVLPRARRAAAAGVEFIHTVAVANLYLYPDASTTRGPPLDGTWHNLEASVRATDAPWTVPRSSPPATAARLPEPGSLGSGMSRSCRR